MNCYKFIYILAISLCLASCVSVREEPEPIAYSELRYLHRPINIKVSKIDIVPEFTPSFTRPNVEHLFPVSIEKTAELWAKDRLSAVDGNSKRYAEFIIKDASVTETEEKASVVFEKDKLKYRAVLKVVIRVTDLEKQTMAEASVGMWRELLIPADTPIDEKERYWNDMLHKLFDAFDERMDNSIHNALNMYVEDNFSIREYN